MPRKHAQPAPQGVALEPPPTAPSTFSDGGSLPKVLVFDLDYTLWPFWIDTHVSPPLKANASNTAATDRTGDSYTFYSDVPSILHAAHTHKIPLALASRTHTPDLALKLLNILHIPTPPGPTADSTAPKKALDFFSHKQIYPGDKKTHMSFISKESGVHYEDMLFFDDEARNRNVEALGVIFWLIRDGTTRDEVDRGILEWRRRRGLEHKHEEQS